MSLSLWHLFMQHWFFMWQIISVGDNISLWQYHYTCNKKLPPLTRNFFFQQQRWIFYSLVSFQSKGNKLGLSWAKLSTTWDWILLCRFVGLIEKIWFSRFCLVTLFNRFGFIPQVKIWFSTFELVYWVRQIGRVKFYQLSKQKTNIAFHTIKFRLLVLEISQKIS